MSLVFIDEKARRTFKCIPTFHGDPSESTSREASYLDVVGEVFVGMQLSKLKQMNGFDSRTRAFIDIRKVHLVKGIVPSFMYDVASRVHDRLTQRPLPLRTLDREWVVLEMELAGPSLAREVTLCNSARLSVLAQVVLALAVAERRLNFLHCDMHLNNILLQVPPETTDGSCKWCVHKPHTATLENTVYQFMNGPNIKIIDYGLVSIGSGPHTFNCFPEKVEDLYIQYGQFWKNHWKNYGYHFIKILFDHVRRSSRYAGSGKCEAVPQYELEKMLEDFRRQFAMAKTAKDFVAGLCNAGLARRICILGPSTSENH